MARANILNKSKHNSTKTIIYCYKGGKKKLKNLCFLAFPNSYIDAFKESNASYNCDEEFKTEKYSVKKIEVDHGRLKPCYGYLFQEKDLTVGFTGDTSFCKAVEIMHWRSCFFVQRMIKLKSDEKVLP